jgi:hypothetical protein
MTIYNQILYVTSFSACISLLGLLSAGQLMPAIRWVGLGGWEAGRSCWPARLLPGSRHVALCNLCQLSASVPPPRLQSENSLRVSVCSFLSRHPEALASIMMLSGAATIGQLFIRWVGGWVGGQWLAGRRVGRRVCCSSTLPFIEQRTQGPVALTHLTHSPSVRPPANPRPLLAATRSRRLARCCLPP